MKDPLDYKEPITKIYFVRHGETKANVKRLLFGHMNLDLTKNGIKQAKHAAKHLVEAGFPPKVGPPSVDKPAPTFDYIISSPLKRTRHTAKIIRKEFVGTGLAPALKIIIDKNLIEKSEGIWEGKTLWQVREKDSKNYYKWLKNPFKNRPPKGESIMDLNKRVKKFYKTILKKYLGKSIIVVTHSGPIKMFILNVLGANINKFWHLVTKCGGIVEIHLSQKHAKIFI